MSGEKVSQFFSQLLLQSKSRSSSDDDRRSNKPSSKSLSNNNNNNNNNHNNESKKWFKRPEPEDDGKAVRMNRIETWTTSQLQQLQQRQQQAAGVVTLSNRQPDTSQLSLLPQNSVLVTTSFSHSIGSTRLQDLESGSLDK